MAKFKGVAGDYDPGPFFKTLLEYLFIEMSKIIGNFSATHQSGTHADYAGSRLVQVGYSKQFRPMQPDQNNSHVPF